MAGAGNIPIVKMRDLVVGTSYRLLDPTLSADIADQMGDVSEEYKKMVNYLHTRPHTLQLKRRLPNGLINVWFTRLPDEPIHSIMTESDSYVPTTAFTAVTADIFPKMHDTEFAQEALRGGRRKTRKSKRKSQSRRRRR